MQNACRRILVEIGFKSTHFFNGDAIILCEKIGLDEPITFHADEIFTPAMTEDLWAITGIDPEDFWKMKEELCDPDPRSDPMN